MAEEELNPFSLANLTRESPKRGKCILIHAKGDVGKTFFGVKFCEDVNGLMVLGEDGMQEIDTKIVRTPVCSTWKEFKTVINSFARGGHKFKGLCIDTLDALMSSYIRYIVDTFYGGDLDAAKSWGAYYVEQRLEFNNLLKAFNVIMSQGVDIIILLHSDVETFKAPDVESFQRWGINLPKSAKANLAEMLYNFSDICLYARFDIAVKKGIGVRGNRVMISESNPSWESKSRIKDMPGKMLLEWDSLKKQLNK